MRYLLHFLWKNYAFLLFLVLEVLSLAIVVNANKHQSAIFSDVANTYGGEIFSSYSNIRDYFHLKDANLLLSQENAILRTQVQGLKILVDSTNFNSFAPLDSTNTQTRDSLKINFDFLSAKVINNSTNRQQNYIMLNKGSQHGVLKNMGIIGPKGIVGVIFEVSDDYSSGISLLNRKLNVSAKIKRNNELGILLWDGKSDRYGQLDAIENYVPILIGDTLVTSGFSHIFPEGEIIGTIDSFEKIPGKTSWKIQVKYATDFSQLYWVNIVRNRKYEQQIALEAIQIDQ